MKIKQTVMLICAGVTSLTAQQPPWPESDFGTQLSEMMREFSAHNYFQAATLTARAERDVRAHAGSGLSRDRFREALAASRAKVVIPDLLEQASAQYKERQWEPALFTLYTVDYALSQLASQMSPQERYKREAANAENQMLPQALHQAARSALDAGFVRESLAYSDRELDSIQRTFRAAPAGFIPVSIFTNRAYTLRGMALLADDQIAEAVKALANSVDGIPAGAYEKAAGPGPQMALASALLARGERQAVLDYLDRCSRVGWAEGQRDLARWRSKVLSNQVPDFPPALLVY